MLNHKVYSHDMIMDKALEFIDKNADKPFFVYLTPTIPHADIIVRIMSFLIMMVSLKKYLIQGKDIVRRKNLEQLLQPW